MNYWFTSDWHLDHKNIIGYCNRPFSSVQEMNDTILSNFFNTVRCGDIVYYLGDFTFSKDIVEIFFNKRLCVQFHFIAGGHDKHVNQTVKRYVDSYSFLREVKLKGQHIVLCHFPMVSHERSHYGSWQLYGHHHRDVSDIVQGKKMNVGVDLNLFYPVNFDTVEAYMNTREDNWDQV